MATTSIWAVKGWLGKVVLYIENPEKTENPQFYRQKNMTDVQAQNLSDVIDYAARPDKTTEALDSESVPILRQLVSGINCLPATARDEMLAAKKRFGKEDGIVAYHGYQSFAPGEATPELAHEIGVKLARKLWGKKYQVLVATHLDKENHLHNHFVVNTVSFIVLNVAYNSYAKQYAINNGLGYSERGRAVTASGSCGANATWALYSDGTLSIQGTGSLTNPTYAGAVAWAAYRESIRTVEIAAGITNLSDFAFFGCTSLTSVIFEDGSKLTTVGGSAFNGCTSLKELILPEMVKTVYGNAFRGCTSLTSVYLPDGLSYMTNNAFAGCGNVVLSVAAGSYAEQWAQANHIAYTAR